MYYLGLVLSLADGPKSAVVLRTKVSNFRGVEAAIRHFQSHTLLVGSNDVGKSTVGEALDLRSRQVTKLQFGAVQVRWRRAVESTMGNCAEYADHD
ncbi:MAG: AAA family ATPase [Planctomycetota bacterium]|jgi:predicted ATPase